MNRTRAGWLAIMAGLAAIGAGGARAADSAPANGSGPASAPAPPAGPGASNDEPRGPRGPGRFGRGGFGGRGRVFGEVTAVRGNVLQLRTGESEGLTRVILASDAQVTGDETLTPDALKPGTKVMGMGRQVPGTGTGGVPVKVEVQSLNVQEGAGGGPFGGGPFFGGGFFGFGGGGPLMRGQRPDVFRKMNYSGSISFSATVKSVRPLVLADDEGNALPVVVGEDVPVHQRGSHPVKEGDITAGVRLLAMGEPTPDGLLNAHMITLLGTGPGSSRPSIPGTITAVSSDQVTVRPRFAPEGMSVQIDPAAKIYFQEKLDLSTVRAGDALSLTGRVIDGTAAAPKMIVVRTITPAGETAPQVEAGGRGPFGGGFGMRFGGFGGQAITATVNGKLTSLEPARIQTDDGREITLVVPGQVAYVHYRPAERSALQTGQKVLLSGRSQGGSFVADLIVINPSLAMGPGL